MASLPGPSYVHKEAEAQGSPAEWGCQDRSPVSPWGLSICVSNFLRGALCTPAHTALPAPCACREHAIVSPAVRSRPRQLSRPPPGHRQQLPAAASVWAPCRAQGAPESGVAPALPGTAARHRSEGRRVTMVTGGGHARTELCGGAVSSWRRSGFSWSQEKPGRGRPHPIKWEEMTGLSSTPRDLVPELRAGPSRGWPQAG